MTTTMPRTALSDFLQYLSTGEDQHHTVDEALVAEMNFPHASFRVEGKASFDHLRDRVSDHPWVLRVGDLDPIPDGFAVAIEIDTVLPGGGVQTTSTITLVRLAGDLITRIQHWCTGAL